MEKIKEKIEKLRLNIEYHNKKYYNEDDPLIEDFEYDMMVNELENLEEKYPQFTKIDSPTNHVGGVASNKFSPVIHLVKMESLHDSFSEEELIAFDKRVRNIIYNPQYVVEPKIDGLSVSVEYKNGNLVRASTRGDGVTGEDITENILTIKNLPKKIDSQISFLEIRGEVYISSKIFAKLVKQQEEDGLKSFKNPRNAAAGSLRQKDAKITQLRNLEIFIFNIQRIEGKNILTHSESLDFLKKLGFPVPPFYKVCSNIVSAIDEVRRIGKIKSSLEFQTDGAVIKINNFEDRKSLGSTYKFPRWAEAFKYPPEESRTQLIDIEVNVGRTGVLTPTGILRPVLLSGTTVSRVVLHNQDFIDEKKIGIGDEVVIRKAGEIIPEVVKVLTHAPNSNIFKIPNNCPSCNSKTIKAESEVAIRCMNLNCPAQLLRNIVHFVSRDAMDIVGVGERVIKKMIENNLIVSPVDLYELNFNMLASLAGLGKKSATNILNAIEKSKNSGLDKVIFALGIRNVGQKAAKILASKFENIDNLIDAKIEDIREIYGIGDVVSGNIIKYFSIFENLKHIKSLKRNKVNMTFLKKSIGDKFTGLTFVLTGTLENLKRDSAKQIIEDYGGSVSSSVSKNTTYVLAGTDAGNKLKKAHELKIKIINEREFLNMVKT